MKGRGQKRREEEKKKEERAHEKRRGSAGGGAHGCKCVLCSQNGGSSVPRVTQDGLGEEPGTQRNLQSTEGNEAAHYAAEQTPI